MEMSYRWYASAIKASTILALVVFGRVGGAKGQVDVLTPIRTLGDLDLSNLVT